MENKAKELNKALKEDALVKEYLTLKDYLLNNKEVINLLKEIKEEQNRLKEVIKEDNKEAYFKQRKKLNDLKDKLFAIPEVNNYVNIKDQTLEFIEQIANILSDE